MFFFSVIGAIQMRYDDDDDDEDCQPIYNKTHQFQGQRSPGRVMLRSNVCHIFRVGRPTNFNLGTQKEHEDPYH